MLKKVHDPIEIDAPGNTSHTAKRCDATVTKCYWCNCAFRARQSGGHAQRFCSPSCRLAFHAATRRWTLDAVGAGVLSIADIKKGTLPTCMLPQRAFDAAKAISTRCTSHWCITDTVVRS